MTRRDVLDVVAVLSLVGAMFCSPSWALEAHAKRANILYIFADQLRADVLGYAGDRKAITPNLDRFASESMNFLNAVSVAPVCVPHRASLITGKYPSSTGMVINELNMNPNHRTIAHVLGESGYNLGYIGKWHLRHQKWAAIPRGPERMGFDGFWAACNFPRSSYQEFYFTDGPDGEPLKVDLKGKHGPTEFTSLAIDFIRTSAQSDKPFTLFLSWNPPHDPWEKESVPRENYEKFSDVRFPLPANFKQTPDSYMDRFPKDAYTNRQWRADFIEGGLEESIRCYYAMVNNLDEQFGRIMDALDDLGIADNTIVVFSSDHGEMFGSQGRMYKSIFYDEAARVPLLVRYPSVVKPGTSDVCINTPDIMPTLLGLTGLGEQIPPEVEGADLSFVLRGEEGQEPAFAFLQGMGHTYSWQNGFEWRAIRDKRFTYAKYRRDGRELLFDRGKDSMMTTDVSEDPAYAADLKRLREAMKQKMDDLQDGFHPVTWYRDHWIYKGVSVKAAARGDFGPLPPVEPIAR